MADPATSVHGADRTAPKIGVFDATMLVMGGIVGAGIFSNPSVVAKMVHSGLLMMVVWSIGGVIALAGAFVYAELAARHPATGGHYAYMRDAFHPAIAFMFGWAILLVVQTGGIAAVSVIFARYFLAVVPLKLSETTVAVLALALLTGINCANLKAGNRTQSLFMVLKVIALVAIIGCGIAIMTHGTGSTTMTGTMPEHPWRALAAAFTPVMFAYGGWQTASFAAGDMRNPARDLSRAMLYGVVGVVALYLA
ncbi:MAG: amino acid permease, partial [Gemmatimonadales bacterium]